MAKNFIQAGHVATLTLPNAVKSGDFVTKGLFAGVATYDAAAGVEVEVALTGVWEIPKGPVAFSQGDACYWDGTKVVAEGDEDAPLIGVAMLDTGTERPVIRVRLSGTAGAAPASPAPPVEPT